jgi:hypothetical protein
MKISVAKYFEKGLWFILKKEAQWQYQRGEDRRQDKTRQRGECHSNGKEERMVGETNGLDKEKKCCTLQFLFQATIQAAGFIRVPLKSSFKTLVISTRLWQYAKNEYYHQGSQWVDKF